MVKAFDFFAFLALLLLLTGGFVHRFTRFYLDLGSVDTAALISLFLLAFLKPDQVARSWTGRKLEQFLSSPEAEHHGKRFFWAVFIILFLAHTAKHWSLETLGFDLSFVHQALFHPLRGPFLPADISPSGSALGEHLLFSLAPLSLITSFLKVDEILFFVQMIAIAAPLWGLFGRTPLRGLGGRAVWLGLIFVLSNRSLRNALMFDFREDTFAFLGFSLALISLLRGKIFPYAGSLMLALLSKEHVALIAPFLSFPILFSKWFPLNRKTRIGLALFTTLLSLAYAFIAFKYLLPYFNPHVGTASPMAYRFRDFGSTPSEIMLHILTTPQSWLILLSRTVNRIGFFYLIMMLLPRFMILLSRDAFLVSIPCLALMGLNILSGYTNQMAMIFHYDLAGLPFLALGTWIGLQERVLPWLDKMEPHRMTKGTLALLLLALSFSEKWPMFHLTFQFPGLDQIEAHLALLKLDPKATVLINSPLSAQVNAHERLIVRDSPCNEERKAELERFQGFRVIDERRKPTSDCPAPAGGAVFSNRLLSIYRYPIEVDSAKLAP